MCTAKAPCGADMLAGWLSGHTYPIISCMECDSHSFLNTRAKTEADAASQACSHGLAPRGKAAHR